MDLRNLTELQLLQIHADVIVELRRRDVVRTSNNPIGDYTEWLVRTCLGLELAGNSQSSYDATDTAGKRYQIKGRRAESNASHVQLSVIRNLEKKGFDYLIAVVFNPDYSIRFAAQIPWRLLKKVGTYRKHVNGHILILRETVLNLPGVTDITSQLQSCNAVLPTPALPLAKDVGNGSGRS